jgi:GNAT superfamily N-acetyltransferase
VKLSSEEIVGLERIAARAWPAAQTSKIGGWRLHASSGFSGRINACWPLEDPGLALAKAVTAVEAWYDARNLPGLFKIVESACAPADLIAHLLRSGYRPRTETVMMIGPAEARADPAVRLSDQVDTGFEQIFTSIAGIAGDARERLETLARIPKPRTFARLDATGGPVAIGACAVEGEWAGVFAMRTDPGYRRRGLARRILHSLLSAAADSGARRIWLQVEADNHGAIALYGAAGFEEAYRYRYWSRETARP